MRKPKAILIISALSLLLWAGGSATAAAQVVVGAERTGEYLRLLEGKKVGILANHTSRVKGTHLVDTLISLGINVESVFAPEHGFRGDADAGEHVSSYRDARTGVNVISVYGTNRKPRKEDVAPLDVVVFDIQDVGLRFYTYLSSMHYMMETCAETGVPMIVLDRPNPNGSVVDGPVLDKRFSSFVGMHPIPALHGMTLGELARMINGEGWLRDGMKCVLTVIMCAGYTRETRYTLPVAPSPNLPNQRSVYLYASLCGFEGTPVSVGRGTDFPFQVYGHPRFSGMEFGFTPESRPGAWNPPHKGVPCYGEDLRTYPSDDEVIARGFDLHYIVDAYRLSGMGERFFLPVFDKLMGTDRIRLMIVAGEDAVSISRTWKDECEAFRSQRSPYLLY